MSSRPPVRLINDTLARVRVCRRAGRPGTPDLLADVEEILEGLVSKAECKKRRDEMIRLAALMLPTAGPYTQAGVLWKEIKALARSRNGSASQPDAAPRDSVREYLKAAAQAAPLPKSQRQVHRILTIRATDIANVEMSARTAR